jgi:hypothetical protein
MNYEKKTISIQKANVLGLLLLPVLACFLITYHFFWKFPDLSLFLDTPLNLLFFIIVIFFSVLAHELIHGLCFMFFAKEGSKSVKIGFIWKYLTPYAHCKESLNINHYRIALLMPGIVLGILPIMGGLVFGYFSVFIFGLFLTLAAGGDLIIFILTFGIPKNKKLLDHSSECGFIIVD